MKSFVKGQSVELKVAAMIKPIDSIRNIKLVVDVTNRYNDERVFYNCTNVTNESSPGKWTPISKTLIMDELNPNDILKVYFWNPKKECVLIDDFSIEYNIDL